MKPDVFVQQAMNAISSDPYDRVPQTVFQMLEKPDTVFESHFHIFDKYCVTKNYFLLRLLGHLDPDKSVDDLLDEMITSEKDNAVDEIFRILRMESMLEILDYYLQHYAYQQNIICVPLMMDLDEGWYFNAEKSQHDQIMEIKNIMQQRAILPFLSIDPRKATKRGNNNLYKLFLKAFLPDVNGNKFFGVKVYPALGYLASDVALWPIYEVCEARNIPVTTHCGGTIIRTYKNNYDLFGYQIVNNEVVSYKYHLDIANGKQRAIFLNDPKHWEVVLKRFPKLKLNLGHFGGIDNWAELAHTGQNEAVETINRLMAYNNVYADISYNIADKDFLKIFKKNFNENFTIRNKTLYGTDFWMALVAGDFKKNHDNFLTKMGTSKEQIMRTNPIKYLFAT